MALGVYKIAPETHRTPLPCGKDVVYTARERERERERKRYCTVLSGCQRQKASVPRKTVQC